MKIISNLAILLAFIALSITSCQSGADETFEVDGRKTENEDLLKSVYNGIPLADIDTSTFEIHLVDSYKDLFVFNKMVNRSNATEAYTGYKGYLIHKTIAYQASAIYSTSTTALAISSFYRDDQNMVYNVQQYSDNYYVGTYTWAASYSQNFYKNYPMTCIQTKGRFNSDQKSAIIIKIPEIDPEETRF